MRRNAKDSACRSRCISPNARRQGAGHRCVELGSKRGGCTDRRQRLLQRLQEANEPLSGGHLAQLLGVSRQVIVQDVALLRAQGHALVATPRGYLYLRSPTAACTAVLAVRHGPDLTSAELYALVDAGLRVVDVIVEHPLYGELKGALMLSSRRDVAHFMAKLENQSASLLSTLTDGVHLHTVEAPTREHLEEGRAALQALGILLSVRESGDS